LPLRSLRLCGEKKRGFTLVELMIVMGVIIVLATLLFPVIVGMREKTRDRQARVEVRNVLLALKTYRMDYGKWPKQNQAAEDPPQYFTNNWEVILPLIARDPVENPRGKVYLTLQATNQLDSLTNFIDPWGVPYVIVLDENMDAGLKIDISNVPYFNMFSSPPQNNSYFASNYYVTNFDAAVVSFGGITNLAQDGNKFSINTWEEAR